MDAWVAPFAISPAPAGGIVHRAIGVAPFLPGGGVLGIHLKCGSKLSLGAVPVDEPKDSDALCPRCDVPGIQVAESVVYFARVDEPRTGYGPPGPYLKVGHTKRLAARLIDLPGELIEQCPGSSREERSLMAALRQTTAPKRGREWFPDTPAVRATALGWFADRLEAAA
jgi:hypothetical protein